jgi:hypothetical protein
MGEVRAIEKAVAGNNLRLRQSQRDVASVAFSHPTPHFSPCFPRKTFCAPEKRNVNPGMKNRLPLLSLGIVATAGLALFAGCQSGIRVKVDSLAKPEAENAIAYQIKTSNPDLDPDSLRFKEAEKFVKTALSGKGLYEAPKPEMADMVVNIDYGISPPKVSEVRRSQPVYRIVPGPIYAETVLAGLDKDGKPVYATVLVQGPDTQEYAGEREYFETIVTYEKYLRLSARENKPAVEGQPPKEVWTVDVTTEGENRDLRKALPALAAASIEFVGKDSQGEKVIRLKDNDKDGAIAFVKKGM